MFMIKIYISPSTQENNVGVLNYGTEKKRMNELADIVVPLLEYNNFTVYRNNPNMSLQKVVEDSNNKNVDAHVALHSNAGGGSGSEIYYTSNAGKLLASSLYKYIEPLTPSKDRGIKNTNKLYELNNTKAPAVLIEISFHDNRDDARFIINNMPLIAEAIVKGICDYFNVTFKKPQPQKSQQSSKTGKLYKVQVGAFSKKENAENLTNKLKSQGYSVYMYKDTDSLYKVQVGAFSKKENADKLASKLKADGYNTFVYED
ncbi:N-acetylmuramoyl-L-alanine amidase [Clostridium sp. USBA 49]|nr:N-acetylmuramoyl-L-alanine amidase [Clostridium sp. USBA 49]